MPHESVILPFSALLYEIKSKDIRIYLEQGRLRCQSPSEVLTPELRTALRTHKSQLIALLARKELPPAPPLEPVLRGQPLPLSFAQQRLWFLEQLEPGTSAYNMISALRLTGRLDVEALERSFNEVVRCHEALRSTFETVDGKPVQLIHSSSALALRIVDLRAWTETERKGAMKRLLQQEAEMPFDLTKGPLLRTALFRVSEYPDQSEYVLLLTMHHIVSDDWSVAILFWEIASLYDAFRKGDPSPLSPLQIQYADFACWQRQWLQGEVLERLLAYWKNKLAGSPPPLSLPVVPSAEVPSTDKADIYDFSWPMSLLERLKELSLQNDVTLFMTLFAAFLALLHRYTGQSDICIGTPIANRNRVDIESIVGFFVNTLVLRTDLSGNPSFAELLKRVEETALGAQAHQDLPFDKLVEELQPVRDLNHSPFFRMMFVLHNVYFEEPEIPGIQTSLIKGIRKSTPFDLTLHFAEAEDGLRGWFEFKSRLFDHAFIQQMEKHLRVITESIVADPQCRLSNMPLLPEAERHQLLVEWNATQAGYPQNTCLHELFEAQVERTPEAVAVVYEDQRLTYGELNARANQLAHYLCSLGVGSEALVGLCVERSLEMIVGILGILKAGVAYVPIDPNYPRERKAYLLADSASQVILTQARWLEGLPLSDRRYVCIDQDGQTIAQYPVSAPATEVLPGSLAYLIYTSGSTGKPKGVQITHGNAVHSTWARFNYYQEPLSHFLLLSSFAFDSSVAGIFWTLGQGGRLCLPAESHWGDPSALIQLIAEKRLSHLLCLPSLYSLLLEQATSGQLKSLTTVIVAGEACSPQLVADHYARLPAARLYNEYGPTETTVWSSVHALQSEKGEAGSWVPIGRPIDNAQIYLLDTHLNPVPTGLIGEMYIGGVGLARGYRSRPASTAERFIPNPFGKAGSRLYRTGDLARYKLDGNLEYVGRIDYQIKIRGYRIELGEVEAVLQRHPQVKKAMAMVREDSSGDKRLVGYIVAREAVPPIEELRAYLKEILPEYMVPAALMFLGSLPLTPNGKVDRKALPAPDMAAQLVRQYVAPRNPNEEALAGVWAEVLGVERIGSYDNFFDLGGHSMLAVRLTLRVREAFGVEMPLRLLFEQPTLEAQARLLEGGTASLAEAATRSINLEAEAELDPSIRPSSAGMAVEISPAAVLLTGATGFLGGFLLRELLQETNAKIYCLVRGYSLPKVTARLRQILERYGLGSLAASPRIIPLQGDLSQPLLGIPPDCFERLSGEIDTIYHNGATVDFTASYETLKPSNVSGTKEVLRFACLGKLKAVHYVSTVSVFGGHSPPQPSGFKEDDFPPATEKLTDGYGQSKWVAERIVRTAAERGLPVTIHRPSTIVGDSRSGVWNTGDFLCRMIKGCIELGLAPELDEPLDLVPVNYVSKAIVFLSSRPDFLGRTFHLTNTKMISSKTLIKRVREFGYSLQTVPVDQWVRDVVAQIKNQPDHVLYPLLPLFEDWQRDSNGPSDAVNQYDCLNTIEALRDGDLNYPQGMEKLIRVFLPYLIRNGFILRPERGTV